MSPIDHCHVPPSLVSERCLAYYRSIADNPYVQHVLPGFRLSLQHGTGADELVDDHSRSRLAYWTAVAANVPHTGVSISHTCRYSYDTNILAMMFAYGAAILSAYQESTEELDLSINQGMALHQSVGLVDAIVYIFPRTTMADRLQYLGILFRALVCFYDNLSALDLLFVFYAVTIATDTVHHLLHALASIWRFAILQRRPSIAYYKVCYHVWHWWSFWVFTPAQVTSTDAAWNTVGCYAWRVAHTYELMGHVHNRWCRDR